jgi:poly(3-hydroxybutyrate) depolymerase
MGAGGSAGTTAVTMSSGCGTEPAPEGDGSIEVDGMGRTYIVELPAGYDQNAAYPLILGFHGAGLDAQGFRGYFDLGTAAGDEAIVAYLDALGNPTGWQYNRDIPFAEAVLMQLKSQYCIDEARVFATGHSSGGYFTNALGCRLGDQLRAIAPVSGGAAVRTMCEGMPAAWIAHGASDNIVPTSEGQGARDFWAEHNGCDTSMSTPVDPSPCVAYSGCSANAPVHYCEYEGQHGPPMFAVEALWTFFRSL